MPRIEVALALAARPDYVWSHTLTNSRFVHDVSEKTLERWERVRREYEKVQDEIEALFDESMDRPRGYK